VKLKWKMQHIHNGCASASFAIMHNFRAILAKDPDTNNYRKYMKYVFNYIKPIAMDFRNAIEAIQNKTDIQKDLISRLRRLQQTAVSYQRNVKSQSAEDEYFFKALTSSANLVYESSLCHFNSFSIT